MNGPGQQPSIPGPCPPKKLVVRSCAESSYLSPLLLQVRDENIRALEPALTAAWLHKAAQCCSNGGIVVDVGR